MSGWPAGVRVLVVEDDPEQRLMLRLALEAVGYGVIEAANGHEALMRCREARPAIVLLDAVMPIMDGAAFLACKLRDERIASIPVVVVSAWDIPRCVGVVSVLRKPARRRDVIGSVRTYAKREPALSNAS